MKKFATLLLMAMAVVLTGCGDKGFDLSKLEACGECLSGLQDLQNVQTMMPILENIVLPPIEK